MLHGDVETSRQKLKETFHANFRPYVRREGSLSESCIHSVALDDVKCIEAVIE